MNDWTVVPFSPADKETADMFTKMVNFVDDITTDILVYGEALVVEQPKCFGAYPISNPVEQAENCCHNCPFNHSCFEKMAQDNPPPWME